jgi:hypothetical protein
MLKGFKTVAIVFLFVLSGGGCVPALLTIEPSADFLVVDTDGNPIEGANVNFATTRGPFGPRTVAIYVTDSKGQHKVKKKKKWHTIVFLPDGTTWYEWNFCVEKSGYKPFASEQPDFGRPFVVALKRSDIEANCQWPTDSPFYPAKVVREGS